MNKFFSCNELQTITAGQWLVASCNHPPLHGIGDDSRNLKIGELFIAIRGTLSDGHKYLKQAIAQGAGALCVAEKPSEEVLELCELRNVPCLKVEDTLLAFHQLAAAHRLRFPQLKVIAITGSSGKTSCKEILASILEYAYPEQVIKTEGNSNNHFGVPRNIFRINSQHRFAVLELGTNHHGEIAQLAKMVKPDIAIITNIGHAHLEALKDLAGVAKEKGSLLKFLPKNGVAILPLSEVKDGNLAEVAKGKNVLTFGSDIKASASFVYHGLTDDELYKFSLNFQAEKEMEINWQWAGEHQAENATAAVLAANYLDVKMETIINALYHCQPPKMRMEFKKKNGITYINDAYNANPDSMKCGLQWFAEYCKGHPEKKAQVIIGDMLELGENSKKMHKQIIDYALGLFKPIEIVIVGKLMFDANENCEVRKFQTTDDTARYMRNNAGNFEVFYLKASRSLKFEKLIL